MNAAYMDTSWAVAVAFGEAGHEELVERLGKFDGVYACNLLEAEFWSAFAREGVTRDPALLASVHWILPDRPLTPEIARALEAGYLRGADLWHVACALFLAEEPSGLTFLTLDASQGEVARRLGFADEG